MDLRWDDLKILLAAHRAGTLLGAARALSTHASTISRRLEALEERLGVHLFDRTPSGLIATEIAESLMPLAEAMEARIADVQRVVEGRETEPAGWVRLTAPPGLASFAIAPALPRLYARYPRVRVELLPSVGYSDLTRREADLALRTTRPSAGDLVSTRLGESELVPMVAETVADDLGPVRDLAVVGWIQWVSELSHLPDAQWIRDQVPADRIVLRCGTYEPMVLAAQAGLGAMMAAPVLPPPGLVPMKLSRRLVRSLPPFPHGSMYLVGHRALRDVPRVAAVWEFLGELFGR